MYRREFLKTGALFGLMTSLPMLPRLAERPEKL